MTQRCPPERRPLRPQPLYRLIHEAQRGCIDWLEAPESLYEIVPTGDESRIRSHLYWPTKGLRSVAERIRSVRAAQ